MIMKVKFPSHNPAWTRKPKPTDPDQHHKYYSVHIQYVLNLLRIGGARVEMVSATEFPVRSSVHFDCKINGHLCRFDFSDFEKLNPDILKNYKAYFKFHYHHINHKKFKNVHPFSPVNFHDWEMYHRVNKTEKYKGRGLILNNQVPAGAAVERRNKVKEMLVTRFGKNVDTKRYDKETFYRLVSKGLVSVCVPGARNNMLDRGQGQHMMLGMCTISPKLNTRLSWHGELVPGKHYVECKPDYSDLIDKIIWLEGNPGEAKKIGMMAERLFKETSLPEMQVKWINKCVSR